MLRLAALAVVCLAGCKGKSPPEVTSRTEEHMSTYVTLSVWAPKSREVDEAITAGFAEVKRLAKELSEWREDSEISKVNRGAGGAPIAVSEELFSLLALSKDISQSSGGAFDVTVASLIGVWDFRWETPRVPTEEELAAKLPKVSWRELHLDGERRAVRLGLPGMRAGLGAIAKGYAVDRASAVLASRGFKDHLVVAGGDLYASGRKGDQRWRVGVRDPENKGIFATLEVEDEGVATSGNYERYFFKDGVRYHHILDARTGKPARGIASVTVIAKNATLADGWATALFVLGKEQGTALARSRGDLEAYYFDEAFAAAGTPGISSRLEKAEGASAR